MEMTPQQRTRLREMETDARGKSSAAVLFYLDQSESWFDESSSRRWHFSAARDALRGRIECFAGESLGSGKASEGEHLIAPEIRDVLAERETAPFDAEATWRALGGRDR